MGSHSIHPETRKALASTATPFGLLRPAELVPRQVIVKSAVNAVLGLLVFVCAYSEIFFKHQTTPAVWWAAVVLPLSCALCYLYLLVAFSRNELRQFPSHQHPVLLVLSVVALLAAHYLVASAIQLNINLYVVCYILILPASFLAGLPVWQSILVLLLSSAASFGLLSGKLPMSYIGIIVLSQILMWLVFDIIIDEMRRYALSMLQLAELRGTRRMLDQVTAQETRDRIARELHDELGHLTTVISHNLSQYSYHHKPVDPLVVNAMEMTRRLAAHVREVSHAWQDGQFDLLAAVDELSKTILFPSIHVDREGFSGKVAARHGRALFRCCQELITNSLRHSNASDVYILFISVGNGMRVIIEDNGTGKKGLEPGRGLQSVKQGLSEVGIEVSMSLGEDGFIAELDVPAP